MESIAHIIRARHGNPNAVFAGARLEPRQKIRLILGGQAEHLCRVVDAVAIGKKKKEDHIVWYINEQGRKWRMTVPRTDILVKW